MRAEVYLHTIEPDLFGNLQRSRVRPLPDRPIACADLDRRRYRLELCNPPRKAPQR